MITFREIDKSNYMECICLKVKDEQRGFVADNARSLAEARFEEGLYTRAVYSDGVMVGFVLFDYDPELPGWCMSRFMIGAQYQGRGLGKEAVLRFLDFMREHMGCGSSTSMWSWRIRRPMRCIKSWASAPSGRSSIPLTGWSTGSGG